MMGSLLQLSTKSRLFSPESSMGGFCMRPPYSNKKECREEKFNSIRCPHWGNSIKRRIHLFRSTNFGQPKAGGDSSIKNLKSPLASLKVLYEFTRPYSCVGLVFGVASSSLIAIENLSDISLPFLIGFLKALTSFLLLTVYSNGINQVFDIEIDKVNKPYLPLASGEMTLGTGIAIVSAFVLMAFYTTYIVGSKPLFWGIFLYFIVTSAYSVDLPLLRWKKTTFSSGFSLFAMRAILQLSVYLHAQTFVFGRPTNFPRPLAFAIPTIGIFFVVVALFKDVPDVEGDQKFGINSLAATLGPKKVFRICLSLIGIVYASAIVVGANSSFLWSKFLTIFGHVVLALLVWKESKSISLNNKAEVAAFYMFIWKLIYAEFLLIPLVR